MSRRNAVTRVYQEIERALIEDGRPVDMLALAERIVTQLEGQHRHDWRPFGLDSWRCARCKATKTAVD